MTRGKTPARFTSLNNAQAHWGSLHPQDGELPRTFTLDFRTYDGPGGLGDGRVLRASLTPAELAEALGAVPARTLIGDDDNFRALMRIIRLLRGEAS